MKHFIRAFFIFMVLTINHLHGYDKVVLWGHKLHSHTHSYIHNAFYIAFKHLGYDTYWFDDKDDVSGFDFSNTFFITEGQVDKNIPIRNDCTYCLHNTYSTKYNDLNPKNFFNLQVYSRNVDFIPNLIKVDNCIFYDVPGRCVYMPWATDLLPDEIEANKKKLLVEPRNYCIWIGTIGDGLFGNIHELTPFFTACKENNIKIITRLQISVEESMNLTMNSCMAPAIVGTWQSKAKYIPCRIFKNISYGKMGITNSEAVYDLFEHKIVYNPDTYQLFFDAKKRLETMTVAELHEQMDFVKNKHTYINRIQTLFDFAELIDQTYGKP